MSPEQLKTLQELSQLFENGAASPKHIKQLSALLADINQLECLPEESFAQVLLRTKNPPYI